MEVIKLRDDLMKPPIYFMETMPRAKQIYWRLYICPAPPNRTGVPKTGT